jgi:putative DNA primase/helicase
VYPCKQNKRPFTEHGDKDASCDPDCIQAWLLKDPDVLIGIATGEPSDILVLDVDNHEPSKNGFKSLAKFELKYGKLPDTLRATTPRNGRHYYFRYPQQYELGSTAGELGPGLDTRGNGGYIIAPPSICPEGQYRFENPETPIAPMPEWLINLLLKKSDGPASSKAHRPSSPEATDECLPDAFASLPPLPPLVAADVGKMLVALAHTKKGKRNNKLNKAAYVIGRSVGGKYVSREQAEAYLWAAGRACGLPDDEIRQTMSSGLEAGIKNPRGLFPFGYEMHDDGLWHINYDKMFPKRTWLSEKFEILGETRDSESGNWGLLIRWQDPDGISHEEILLHEKLAGRDSSAWRAGLASRGLKMAAALNACTLLTNFFAQYKAMERILCVQHTGWNVDDTIYVLPDEIFFSRSGDNPSGHAGHAGQSANDMALPASGSDSSQPDNLDGNPPTSQQPDKREQIALLHKNARHPFRTAGTLEAWRNTIGLWAEDNPRLGFALCVSLAAPLLKLSGQESGGFNFTGGSSTGKTTILCAAASPWGDGSSSGGYSRSWRTTSNGLESTASTHNDTLLCLDDIGQASSQTIREAAYMLANGLGKTRARADGSAREAKAWGVLILSTGEQSPSDMIELNGGKAQAGQLVRLVNIPADAGYGHGVFKNLHGHESARAFADAIRQAATRNYGHAARAFIQFLVDHRVEVQESLDKWMNEKLRELVSDDADGQVKRVARRFLLCAFAGETAARCGILPWDEGEALAVAKICFAAWIEDRGGTGPAEDDKILSQIMYFFEQHGDSRFQDLCKPEYFRVCPNRAGFRDVTGGVTTYYVLPEVFKREICQGFNAQHAAKLLCEKGILERGDSGYTRRPPHDLPGWDRKRCYVIKFQGNESVDTHDEEIPSLPVGVVRPGCPAFDLFPGQPDLRESVDLSGMSGMSGSSPVADEFIL